MQEVSEERAIELLGELGAVWEGHYIGAKLKHLSAYVQKDVPTTHPGVLRVLARGIAYRLRDLFVDVIASPELGAILLGGYVAEELGDTRFAIIEKTDSGMAMGRAAFIEAVANKRVGIIEDIITSGDTTRQSIAAVTKAGGNVLYVSGLWNRSGQTAESIGVPEFRPLVNRELQDWPDKESCELCAKGVPIVINVGHAEEFRAQNPDFDIEYVTRS